MKVGFFSPLPPAPTGVADYSETLLSWLRQLGAVEIAPEKCDVALYHVGNNTLHRDIYQRAIAHPGVVVLHDAVLQHLLLGMLDPDEYVEEFVYNYGDKMPRARAGPPVVGAAGEIRRRHPLLRATHAQAHRQGLARDHRA